MVEYFVCWYSFTLADGTAKQRKKLPRHFIDAYGNHTKWKEVIEEQPKRFSDFLPVHNGLFFLLPHKIPCDEPFGPSQQHQL